MAGPKLPDGATHDRRRGEDWRTFAACLDHDPELWFSDDRRDRADATAICDNECPVRQDCRATAARLGETHGIWGGTNRNRNHHAKEATA